MATQASQNVASLFKDLNRLGKDGDYERALKVANKLLTEIPDDEKVFQCKIVCMLQLGKYEDILITIKKNPKFVSYLTLEKAYCEYRLNRCEEALKTINNGDSSDPRVKELLGQLYYRMENYEESYNLYRDVIKNSQDDFEDERETNLSAVVAALRLWKGEECENLNLREETYEMCYNSGCRLIGERAYGLALEKLKKAEEMCRMTFAEDPDASEDDISSELSIIWVQMGFVLQKLGKNEEALRLYNQVIKQKPSDAVLMAVASNNIVTINKEQNMFDSKKRIKTATSGDLKSKLTTSQKRLIAANECLLHMYGGQADQCKKSAKVLQGSSHSAVKGSLIEAAQLIREKNADKAIEFLQNQIEKLEEQDVSDLKLALAQIYLNQEHVYKACDVLRTLGEDAYTPGIVSTLVSLYLSQEDHEMATDILGQAVEWYLINEPESEDLIKLVQANANFHLNSGSPKVAAEMLERMRKSNPTDLKLLAQLILAYSKFNPKKAQEVSKEFPPPEKLPQDVDLDLLESSAHWLGNKWAKKATKVEASPMSPKCKTDVVVKKKSKNRKKKVLPKNYDPNVIPDPERWLPLRERSTYKGKKKNKKRDVGRGTQGSVAVGVSELDASEHHQNGSETGLKVESHPSPSGIGGVNGPRQQKPTAAAAKQRPKKKKGGRW